jgi:hypothetical protein
VAFDRRSAARWRRLPVRRTHISKCDGPVQPDGTGQRCVAVRQLSYSGASSFLVPERRGDVMRPDQHLGDLAFAQPPTHIND